MLPDTRPEQSLHLPFPLFPWSEISLPMFSSCFGKMRWCGTDEALSVVSSPCVRSLALTSEGGVSVGEVLISWDWLYGLPGRTAPRK